MRKIIAIFLSSYIGYSAVDTTLLFPLNSTITLLLQPEVAQLKGVAVAGKKKLIHLFILFDGENNIL